VDLSVQAGLGAEYAFRNLVFVRGGKRFYNDDRAAPGHDGFLDHGLSGGFGLKLPVGGRSIRFDYSYTTVGDLNDVQVFSFDFGGQ
jgi:hypothetical protein